MPPLVTEISDSAGESEDEIPYRKPKAGVVEDDEDESEDEGDEYVVDKILKHDWHENGTLLFQIKWQGYPDPKDFTWEEEENLEKLDALKDYYKKIGGRPDFDTEVDGKGKGKGRGRGKGKGKRTFSETAAASTPDAKGRGRKKRAKSSESGTPVVDVKRAKAKYPPPPGQSWENCIQQVQTIDQQLNPATGENERFGLLQWDNGETTRHTLRLLHDQCPKKMCEFYAAHLVFTKLVLSETNGQSIPGASKSVARLDQETIEDNEDDGYTPADLAEGHEVIQV